RSVTGNTIAWAFAAFSPIPNTVHVNHHYNPQRLGVAYIQFKYEEDALEAKQMMHSKEIKGQQIEIDYQQSDKIHQVIPDFGPRPPLQQNKLNQEDVNKKMLFISNIDKSLSSENLGLILKPFSITRVDIQDVIVSEDIYYCLIEFKTEKDAIYAYNHLNGKKIQKRKIKLHNIILRIGNLDEETDENDLYNFFKSKLPDIDIRIILRNNNNNLHKTSGYGYLNFDSVDDAQLVLGSLNHSKLKQNGHKFSLEWWQPSFPSSSAFQQPYSQQPTQNPQQIFPHVGPKPNPIPKPKPSTKPKPNTKPKSNTKPKPNPKPKPKPQPPSSSIQPQIHQIPIIQIQPIQPPIIPHVL
ncbi:MAG: hypothetical protein EZS28_050339, partial [Streblomastix strix]